MISQSDFLWPRWEDRRSLEKKCEKNNSGYVCDRMKRAWFGKQSASPGCSKQTGYAMRYSAMRHQGEGAGVTGGDGL
jgi:hypothetical protein